MLHDIIFLVIGLALILLGGNIVTNGSVAIAGRFRISPLVVGMTVVAFGSSTPDFVVSMISTINLKTQLALGNIVGAVIFDMLLVIGITALIHPIKIGKNLLRYDLPIMVAGALVVFVCADDHIFDHSLHNTLSRIDGAFMLMIFTFFMVVTLRSAHTMERPETAVQAPTKATATQRQMKLWIAIALILGGLASLIVGGRWIVSGASGLAQKAGMSEALIGLTIVGVGSSLPDLATSVMAALKHQPGIALGNVVGSCIIDILFVLGACAVVHPLHAGTLSFVDFATLAAAALCVLAMGTFRGKNTITRAEGAALILGYVAYIVYLCL